MNTNFVIYWEGIVLFYWSWNIKQCTDLLSKLNNLLFMFVMKFLFTFANQGMNKKEQLSYSLKPMDSLACTGFPNGRIKSSISRKINVYSHINPTVIWQETTNSLLTQTRLLSFHLQSLTLSYPNPVRLNPNTTPSCLPI